MINLLPPDTKQTYVYAHRNTGLSRLVTGLSFGLVGVIVVLASAFFILQQQTDIYKDSIAISEADLKNEQEAETIAKVTGINDSIKLSVDVLSQEILFSELLRQVGSIMPRGTVLQSLSLSNNFSGALDLEAGAINYAAASQVQVNLQDASNKIFAKADLNDIQCAEGDEAAGMAYPCTVSLRALFGENTSFFLISPERGNQ